jgi:hypothetical protein
MHLARGDFDLQEVMMRMARNNKGASFFLAISVSNFLVI